MREDKINCTERVVIYLTPAQKERLVEIMLKDSYDISLSTFIRRYLLKNLIKIK